MVSEQQSNILHVISNFFSDKKNATMIKNIFEQQK